MSAYPFSSLKGRGALRKRGKGLLLRTPISLKAQEGREEAGKLGQHCRDLCGLTGPEQTSLKLSQAQPSLQAPGKPAIEKLHKYQIESSRLVGFMRVTRV